MSIQRQLYLERMKKLVEMDPKKHVKKNPENGMFCVYDNKGKKVKEFKSKEDAEKYATDNHDALMKENDNPVNKIQGNPYGALRPKGIGSRKKMKKEDVDEAVTANVKFKSDNAGAAALGSETSRTGLLDGGKKVKDGEYRLTFKNDRMKDKFMKKYSMKLEDVEQVDEMMPHGMNLSVKSIEKTPSMIAYRKKVKQDHEKRMAKLKKERGGTHKQPVVTTTESEEKIDEKEITYSVELSEADKVMINELFLFITNDAQLYRQRITPLIKNYQRKMKKGIFDQEMAVKGFLYAVNDGIKKYNKEFGSGSMKLSKQEKEAVATKLLDYYQEELAGG